MSAPSNTQFFGLFNAWLSSGFNLDLPPKADLIVPFFKSVSYPLGVWGFIALSYCVIVGSSKVTQDFRRRSLQKGGNASRVKGRSARSGRAQVEESTPAAGQQAIVRVGLELLFG